MEADFLKDIVIERWTGYEDLPLNLLLDADPSAEMINAYIQDSEVYLAKWNDKIIGVYVLFSLGDGNAEIKNISVLSEFHRRGVGKRLLNHAIQHAKNTGFAKLIIGTADSSADQLAFYQRYGFRISDRKKNFFIDHYVDAIFENNVQARDMIILEMTLS